MTKKIKAAMLILICLVLSFSFASFSFAENENNSGIQKGILCISYRGDTALYEQNSPEAVLSAFSKGADFVSVSVRKNHDNELVLCSEEKEEISGITLKEMLSLLKEGNVLILDFNEEIKDDIYDELKSEKALSRAYLRIKDKSSNINSWVQSKEEKPIVIGVSKSFNIFTIKSFVKNMASMPMITLQSKNYFNVMYGSLCCEDYAKADAPLVIAPMYDPDLCGQRSDSEDGWNDLIKKNFSIIETNNLDAFISYKNNIEKLKDSLRELLIRTEKMTENDMSDVSADNLYSSIKNAKALINESTASCDELQKANSALMLSINTITNKQAEDTKKGALNITPGKIIAAVLVGFSLLAAEIFLKKMQREKKRK